MCMERSIKRSTRKNKRISALGSSWFFGYFSNREIMCCKPLTIGFR
jgi:hypothetical protein